jgi:hypothetical protein
VHPFNAPIWLLGLGWYLFAAPGRPFRILGMAYLVILILLMVRQVKAYYLTPVYPMLLAAGAVAIEDFVRRRQPLKFVKPVLVSVLAVGGAILAPMAVPILPPETYAKYESALGIAPPKEERRAVAELPQHFADRFG